MPIMKWLLSIALATLACAAHAQSLQPPGVSATAMIGAWEFSDAERDKICTVKFSGEPTRVGFKIAFDANCGNLYPVARQIAGWKFPDNDLLYLLDAKGEALISFSEVEDGIFEAPTPGIGVLFLQKSAGAAPPLQKRPEDVAGDWQLKRGDGSVACTLTLAAGGFSITVKPGCDAAIAKLNFAQWRLDRDVLLLVPARGDPWRFEEADGNWRRLSETAEPVMLERP
jgi:Protease inhibitor Inh